MQRPIHVLIVDDSPLFKETVCNIVQSDSHLKIVGVASDGRQALEMAQTLRPDIITMDIFMPVMNGLEAIDHIMALQPTPILVVTSDPSGEQGQLSMEALRRGALDLVVKTRLLADDSRELLSFKNKLRMLAQVPVMTRQHQVVRATAHPKTGGQVRHEVVTLVGSTGGPAALATIFAALPSDFPMALLVVQHLSTGFSNSLASWLDQVGEVPTRVAKSGDQVLPGRALIAPDDQHIAVDALGRVVLSREPAIDGHRPSGSHLLQSVARHYGPRGVGVILTGIGDDGVSGLRALRQRGGVTLVQDRDSCVVYGMPGVALETGAAQMAVPLAEISRFLCRLDRDSTRA